MPLHLNSITDDHQNSSLLAWILQNATQEYDSIFATPDKKYLYFRKNILDTFSEKTVGMFVYTIMLNQEQKTLELLDADMVLNNEQSSQINFSRLLKSTDSNEYYEVEASDNGQHFVVETVNRYTAPENLTGTNRNVYISIFPFQLSVYENIEEFNKYMGFSKPVKVGNTDLTVGGYNEKFAMPGGMFNSDDELYSFMVGKVMSYRDIRVNFGEHELSFTIVWADTAAGVVPVAVNRDVFDLSNLKAGCIIGMNADVKADVALSETFE